VPASAYGIGHRNDTHSYSQMILDMDKKSYVPLLDPEGGIHRSGLGYATPK